LIRQKPGLCLALEIGVLSVVVIKTPLFALLMAVIGFLQLPAPGLMSTNVTAIAMPSIAGSANEKELSTLLADYLKKYNDLRNGRHRFPKKGWTTAPNRDRLLLSKMVSYQAVEWTPVVGPIGVSLFTPPASTLHNKFLESTENDVEGRGF
jgi:hypothetical protein